jgi:hypothetical protein
MSNSVLAKWLLPVPKSPVKITPCSRQANQSGQAPYSCLVDLSVEEEVGKELIKLLFRQLRLPAGSSDAEAQ